MKILLVNKFHYRKGGAETYYFALADALKKAGHEVIFFSMKDEKNEECEQDKYFVSNSDYNNSTSFFKKIRMLKNIVNSKEAEKKMQELLKDEKPDLAILSNIHRQITCSIIPVLKKNNVKIVWTMHDLINICPAYTMLDSKFKICEKCMQRDYKNCIKNKCIKSSYIKSYLGYLEARFNKKNNIYDMVDLYVCPSFFYKSKLSEAHFTTKKIVAIRNPLPYDVSYGKTFKSDNYILYFGRLSKEKGIEKLILAMKNVDYKLKILGIGPMEQELKNLVSENKLDNRVNFCGFKKGKELEEYVKNARAVVLPSQWYENGPYSAMEAMAKGKPLIVSNLGGLPELVEDGENGYIFCNEQELEESLKKVISMDNETYIQFCKNSLDFAKEKFDADNYVKSLFEELNLIEN